MVLNSRLKINKACRIMRFFTLYFSIRYNYANRRKKAALVEGCLKLIVNSC